MTFQLSFLCANEPILNHSLLGKDLFVLDLSKQYHYQLFHHYEYCITIYFKIKIILFLFLLIYLILTLNGVFDNIIVISNPRLFCITYGAVSICFEFGVSVAIASLKALPKLVNTSKAVFVMVISIVS